MCWPWRRSRRVYARVLAPVCVLLLFGHWLDLYLLIMPATLPAPALGVLEVLLPAGYAALFLYLTARALGQAPLMPVGDPRLEASLHHET